jgi:hypothetical protein
MPIIPPPASHFGRPHDNRLRLRLRLRSHLTHTPSNGMIFCKTLCDTRHTIDALVVFTRCMYPFAHLHSYPFNVSSYVFDLRCTIYYFCAFSRFQLISVYSFASRNAHIIPTLSQYHTLFLHLYPLYYQLCDEYPIIYVHQGSSKRYKHPPGWLTLEIQNSTSVVLCFMSKCPGNTE